MPQTLVYDIKSIRILLVLILVSLLSPLSKCDSLTFIQLENPVQIPLDGRKIAGMRKSERPLVAETKCLNLGIIPLESSCGGTSSGQGKDL